MSVTVTVRRRSLKVNYFEYVQPGGGYSSSPAAPPSTVLLEDWKRITNLDVDYPTGEVAITFTEEYPSVPIMVKLEVYRYSEQSTNKYQRIPVFFDFGNDSAPIKTTGFTIYINTTYESLTGVFIEFGFREYTS